jgi:hypothetical protein
VYIDHISFATYRLHMSDEKKKQKIDTTTETLAQRMTHRKEEEERRQRDNDPLLPTLIDCLNDCIDQGVGWPVKIRVNAPDDVVARFSQWADERGLAVRIEKQYSQGLHTSTPDGQVFVPHISFVIVDKKR